MHNKYFKPLSISKRWWQKKWAIYINKFIKKTPGYDVQYVHIFPDRHDNAQDENKFCV